MKTAAEMKAEADREERVCSCGAGHGSLEGHMVWCDFITAKKPPRKSKSARSQA